MTFRLSEAMEKSKNCDNHLYIGSGYLRLFYKFAASMYKRSNTFGIKALGFSYNFHQHRKMYYLQIHQVKKLFLQS